jgi:hypothetical protein
VHKHGRARKEKEERAMDLSGQLGKLTESVSTDELEKALDTVKKGAEKINNDKVKEAVDKVSVEDITKILKK